jgi:hypothetical protein
MAYGSLSGCPNMCKNPLPIRVMIKSYFGHFMWRKGDVKPPIQPPLGGVTKIQVSLYWRRKPREKRKRESWRNKLNQASGPDHKLVKTISASLSPSSCGSTIFGEIAPISSSCAEMLLLASKICLYLDVWDPLVLSIEELVVPPFDIVEEDLGGFGP